MNFNFDFARLAIPDAGDQALIFTGSSPYGSHVLGSMQLCSQLFAYEHILGLDPVALSPNARMSQGRVRGSLFHVGMAHHYARRGAAQPGGFQYEGRQVTDPAFFLDPIRAIRVAIGHMPPAHRDPALNMLGQVEARLGDYVEWARTRDQVRILAVEELQEANYGGYPYSARKDLVVQGGDGIWIWDHKGSANMDRDHVLYSSSMQIHGLRHLGCEKYGKAFRGVLLNYVSWADNNRIERRVPEPGPAMTAAVPMMVKDAWDQARNLLLSGRDPWHWPRNPHACVDKWGGKCPAYDLCMLGRPRHEVAPNPNPAVLKILRPTGNSTGSANPTLTGPVGPR